MGVVKSVRIKRNRKAIAELLSSAEVAAFLQVGGDRIHDATGEPAHFEVVPTKNRDRAVVFVKTADADGKRLEAEDRVLTRAVGAGR